MTPGFAKSREELFWLPYPEPDKVIIDAHNFTPPVAPFDPSVNGKTPIGVWCPSRDDAGNGTSTLNDLIGSNDGTLINMATPANNWVVDTNAGGVRAIEFDGSNDIVALASSVDLAAANYCFSGWFKNTVLSGGDVMIGSTSPNYLMVVDATTIYMNLASGFSSIAHGGSVATGAWKHYVISRSGSTVTWYVNGSSLGTKTNSGLMTFSALGGYRGGTATFQGRIDDVRIFDQALDSSDVAALYASGAGRGVSA